MNFLKKAACIGLALTTFGLSGCGIFGSKEPKTYTVKYADGNEIYEITVTEGETYGILHYPTKTWYNFAGLYDEQTGGTQYVDKNGESTGPYTAGKDMTLYPQFTPQEFTVTLDYQGGSSVSGGNVINVAYGEQFANLPTDVTAEHKVFAGWYTKGNKGGVKVGNGTEFNDTSFNLYASEISLYAGYDTEQYQVTLCFGGSIDDEVITVPYDTPLSELCYETRNDNGEGVLTWSKTNGGNKFTGKITETTTLYATGWAPTIELDSDGGSRMAPIVANAGDNVVLPKPEKDLYKFMGWKNSDGTDANITVMPEGGASLTAKWQGKLVYDTNGGTPIDDQSYAAGTKVTLPIPTKTGYVFANWYDTDGEVYTSSIMPVNGVKLKAGWYKAKFTTKTVNKVSSGVLSTGKERGPSPDWMRTIDLSEYIPETGATIEMRISYNLAIDSIANYSYERLFGIYIYDQPMANSSYLLDKKIVSTKTKTPSREAISYDVKLNLSSNKVYMMMYAKAVSGEANPGVIADDIIVTISYPDMSKLFI